MKRVIGLSIIVCLSLLSTGCIKLFRGTSVVANLDGVAKNLVTDTSHLDVWITINGSVRRIGRWVIKTQPVDLPSGEIFNEIQVQDMNAVVVVTRDNGDKETQFKKIGVVTQPRPGSVLPMSGIEFSTVLNLRKAGDIFFTVEQNNANNLVPTGPVAIQGVFGDGPGRAVRQAKLYIAGHQGDDAFLIGQVTLIVAEDRADLL